MSDDPKNVIEFAIRSAFDSYPNEDDPDWRSPHWIKPNECVQSLTLNCAGRLHSIRAKTCSRAAKNCCQPYLAPWYACC
jgi:hypothetical protein